MADALTFSDKTELSTVNINDDRILFKGEAQDEMQVWDLCSIDQYVNSLGQCTPCSDNRVANKLNGQYCLSCGEMWETNQCRDNRDKLECQLAL